MPSTTNEYAAVIPIPAISETQMTSNDLADLDDGQHHPALSAAIGGPCARAENASSPSTSSDATTIGPVEPVPKMRTTP